MRTIANMVDRMGSALDFRIVTSDRDQGDDRPFPGIELDRWNTVGPSMVFHASRATQSLSGLARVINATPHDVLYLNGYFDPVFSLFPLLSRSLRRIQARPTVLAPRGEFSEGAVTLKRAKKLAYRAGARLMGLHANLIWQASSELERTDIQRFIGATVTTIVVAPDLAAPVGASATGAVIERKKGGPLRVCFLSRVSRKKNLDFALRVLAHVRCPVLFHIHGPREDNAYWRECQALIDGMPPNVTVRYEGMTAHEKVHEVFRAYDLFLFPTRGENFGHVILESMRAGTPVLIADTTPWRGLEALGVGWDLPLNDSGAFASAIEKAYAVDGDASLRWRERVEQYALEKTADASVLDASRRLFHDAIGRPTD
ncbi:hypothetical protein BH09GEM1_BH09GEM1_04340 [soil metagenome]